jgi:hypothetical protein
MALLSNACRKEVIGSLKLKVAATQTIWVSGLVEVDFTPASLSAILTNKPTNASTTRQFGVIYLEELVGGKSHDYVFQHTFYEGFEGYLNLVLRVHDTEILKRGHMSVTEMNMQIKLDQ